MILKHVISATAIALSLSAQTSWAESSPKPKYGPEATTLTRSHEYFRRADAPDFWALIPYYTAQQTGSACSLASVTMVMNGARSMKKLTVDDELVTQDSLLKKTGSTLWQRATAAKLGFGVTLDQLGELVGQSFKAYGFNGAKVEVVHAENAQDIKTRLHQALVENEKSSNDFIIINFNQKIYTGDAEVGHIAPIAAYDAVKKKVLVLDPDRQWYEPYWVSEETLLAGMATKDTMAGKNRGFVWVKFSQ